MNRPLLWSRVRRLVLTTLFCVIALRLMPTGDLRGQEQEKAGSAKSAVAEKNRFTIPDGDADEIHAFMEKLAQTPPKGETEEEQLAFSVKALETLVTAADKLLAAKPSAEQEEDAYAYKLEGLQALIAMGQDDARKPLEKVMVEARNHDRQEIVIDGWKTFISDRTSRWTALDAETKQALRDEILKTIDADGPQPLDVSIVQATAMQLERTDEQDLIKLLEQAIPKLQSDDQDVQAGLAEVNFEGMLRRLTLLGKPMELSGELLSGKKLDWDSYRGKVVLVDFWASWCGPCRAEVPNILAMYEAYHDKGFEVLGVSLDAEAKDANAAVREMKLPWDSIFPKDEDQREFNHPLVRHYGINGIPTAILVDKEGRVVSLNARGEVLGEELKKLLGEPAEPAEEQETAETAASG